VWIRSTCYSATAQWDVAKASRALSAVSLLLPAGSSGASTSPTFIQPAADRSGNLGFFQRALLWQATRGPTISRWTHMRILSSADCSAGCRDLRSRRLRSTWLRSRNIQIRQHRTSRNLVDARTLASARRTALSLLALGRHSKSGARGPLPGVEQTQIKPRSTSVYDPTRTSVALTPTPRRC
jgi:hypothetical protein